MNTAVVIIKKYGNHSPKSFDLPEIVSLIAKPRALHDMTVKLPIDAHKTI